MNRYFLSTALLAWGAVTGFAAEVRIESPDLCFREELTELCL